jgi:hypothetical protein
MADDVLATLDRAIALSRGKRVRRPQQVAIAHVEGDVPQELSLQSPPDRWSWMEAFLCVQFLWGALLFLPGSQAYRALIRALPYISSLGLMVYYLPTTFRGRFPVSTIFLVAALGLLTLNVLHPASQLYPAIAQCVFQLTIAAPMFWACKAVRSPKQLQRVLVLIFVLNCFSAALGVLQVYFPEQLMPPQFNSLGRQLNDYYVESLSYLGRDGTMIVRPPGLTDMPGGAALAGGLSALLGLGLSLSAKTVFQRIGSVAAVAIGLAVIYLTQVRSVLLMVIGGLALLSVVAFRQRRVAAAAWIAVAGGALVVTGFFWAASIGGTSVEQRFLNLRDEGAFQTYQENRGHFVRSTVGDLLDEFPLGAGVGRWGMMNTYFAEKTLDARSQPFHVELQLTGWLLDGGIPMWLLYGGAILTSLLASFKLAGAGHPEIANLAILVLALQLFIAGLAMAGPVFNTQLGILFWALASALHGVATVEGRYEAFTWSRATRR